MNASPNFDEWSREQKEEYSKKRMLEMRLKNAKVMQRHAEVEQDRIEAEKQNSAVTNIVKVISKTEKSTSNSKSIKRDRKSREWDHGKPDKEYWTSPERESFGSYKSYKSSQFDDGKYDWYQHPENKSSDQSFRNKNYTHSSKNSNSYLHFGTKKSKEICWKSQKSYADEKMSKRVLSDSIRIRSRSSTNNSDYFEKATKFEKPCMWQSDQIDEEINKYTRVESWVTTVNESNHWNKAFFMKQNSKNTDQSSSEFDQIEHASNLGLNSNNSTTNSVTEEASLKNNQNVCQIETGHYVTEADQYVAMDRNPRKVTEEMPGKEPAEEEGLWEATEQLDIVWRLSDDEDDFDSLLSFNM